MNITDLANVQMRDLVRQLAKTADVLDNHDRNIAATKGRQAYWYGERADVSICRAVRALDESPLRGDLERNIPLEVEQSDRLAKVMGREPRPGYLFWPIGQRDLTTAVASQGGYLVAAQHPADAFIPALRATSVAASLGVQYLPMAAPAKFTRMTGDVTVGWLATEITPAPESTPTFGEIAATAKTVGAYVEASRAWVMSVTPAAETWMLQQMAAAIGAAFDAALIAGTGASGQPTGIMNTAGITTASGASLDWAKTTEAMTDLQTANAVINQSALGWAFSPSAELIVKRRERATGSGFVLDSGRVDGRRAVVSNSVPSGAAIYGDWSTILIPEWSAIEVGVDRFGAPGGNELFKRGAVGFRVLYRCDIVLTRPASFSVLTGVT